MIRTIESAVERIEKVAEQVVIWTFGVMVIAVLITVLTRNISIPVTWLEELSRYMQIWFVSVGFALALRKGMLAGTEVVLKSLPEKTATVVIYVSKCIMLVISILMVLGGTRLIKHLFASMQLSPNMRIPIVWIYLGIYTGFVLTIVFLATSLLINIAGRKDEMDKTFEPAPDVDELNEAVARAAENAGGGTE